VRYVLSCNCSLTITIVQGALQLLLSMAEEDPYSVAEDLTPPESTTSVIASGVPKIRPSAEETEKKQATLAAAKSSIKSSQSQQASIRHGILDRIRMDKEARRLSKAASKIPALPFVTKPASTPMPPSAAAPIQKPRESRLRIQTPTGSLQRAFPIDSRLADVVSFVEKESGSRVGKLETRMPRNVVWEEAKAVIDENAVRDRALERTLEEAVGLGNVVLVATFSTVKETKAGESLI
jgi:hypothetical protein